MRPEGVLHVVSLLAARRKQARRRLKTPSVARAVAWACLYRSLRGGRRLHISKRSTRTAHPNPWYRLQRRVFNQRSALAVNVVRALYLSFCFVHRLQTAWRRYCFVFPSSLRPFAVLPPRTGPAAGYGAVLRRPGVAAARMRTALLLVDRLVRAGNAGGGGAE